ncbi:urease accessory protein UreD [Kocuria sp.]|uniref:urease accessory protein UreD n=1 Tax=Kocuria sp. TaxID=1871328 RepID=UPI0026DFE772|nr:urease accessory protein UreD [Kocuria sp.]MDO5618906.1 urease accessory protein UreD [Kocuria sp.]
MVSEVTADQLTGGLRLEVERRGDQNVVTGQRHHGALRLLRPLYLDSSGQPCLTVVNPGGGYVGGDRYSLCVNVGSGASALVTTQSATKVYRSTGSVVVQEQSFTVGPGATLEVVPDALIAYAEADYLQRTHVTVSPSARVVLTDVITPGWAPDGSLYRWSSVLLRTTVARPDGRLITLDTLRLVPHDDAVADHGFMAGRTHLGTLLAVAPEIDARVVEAVHQLLTQREATEPGLRCGVTPLSEPGLAVRILGPSTEVIHNLLLDAHAILRGHWGNQPRLNLRKY